MQQLLNTFFLAAHSIFSIIGHILQHEGNIKQYKKTEIPFYNLSDLYQIKSEISSKRKLQKVFKHMNLNNILLNNHWTKEIKGEIKKTLGSNKTENTIYQKLEHSIGSVKSKVYSCECLH
jgi:hypothetical protein